MTPLRLSALVALLTGCVTETGNPELVVELRAAATTTQAERVAVGFTPELRVDAAWVNLEDVRLVEADACDTAAEVEHGVEGPFETDLLADAPTVVEIPAGATDYCRLRLRLSTADGVVAAPAELDDHSVWIAGTRADGVPFTIASRRGFELDLRSRGAPFALDEAHDRILLGFDMDTWIGDIGLQSAEPEDGVVRVDDEHEDDLLDAFEDAVEAALGLWRDGDGDGDVDDDEDDLLDD